MFEGDKRKRQITDVKLEFTFWDKFAIIGYNMVEPTLTSLMLASSLEVAEFGTCVYMLMILGILVPFLLTENSCKLYTKKVASCVIIFTACGILMIKMYVYMQWTTTTYINAHPQVQRAIGVYPGRWSATFYDDLSVLIFAVLQLLHYEN